MRNLMMDFILAYSGFIFAFFTIFSIAIIAEHNRQYDRDSNISPGNFISNFLLITSLSCLITGLIYYFLKDLFISTIIGGLFAFQDKKIAKKLSIDVLTNIVNGNYKNAFLKYAYNKLKEDFKEGEDKE